MLHIENQRQREDKRKGLTTIAVTQTNYEKLRELGKTGESFNDVLTRLLDKK